jgi:hypothetical protein
VLKVRYVRSRLGPLAISNRKRDTLLAHTRSPYRMNAKSYLQQTTSAERDEKGHDQR